MDYDNVIIDSFAFFMLSQSGFLNAFCYGYNSLFKNLHWENCHIYFHEDCNVENIDEASFSIFDSEFAESLKEDP